MNAKQFRLVLALLAAALLGYHMGGSKDNESRMTNSEVEDKRAVTADTDRILPTTVPQDAEDPPFEFTRQYAMDRDVTHYSPWAKGGGYQFRPTERKMQRPQRYQPGTRNQRPFNSEELSAPVQPDSYRNYGIDSRFRPLDRRHQERSTQPGGYKPMSAPHTAGYIRQL